LNESSKHIKLIPESYCRWEYSIKFMLNGLMRATRKCASRRWRKS